MADNVNSANTSAKATLRRVAEQLLTLANRGYKVTQRGQMHIRHLRELATKISSLQYENTDLMKYFCNQIQALCKAVLMDCCVELEDSAEGIQRAALSRDHVCFLENHRPVPKHIARKYQQVCLSSEECISKIFLSIVPHLIQNIKEIFVHEGISEVQNGLRGLCEEKLEQFLSKVRDAEQNIEIIQLVCIACEFLGQLCQENCGNQPPAEIEKWVETLAMFPMLNFLKPFFQHCPQDIRLYKRLEAFSLRLLKIMSHQLEIADEVFTRDFSDVSLSLIRFAKFSPSKLVRFELTNSTNSPVSIDRESNNINNNNNENVQYDRHHETFYQWFEIRKESEDELQLHASALVHIDGRICRKGAFQSTIFLKASAEEAFNACMVEVTDVAADKAKDEDSSNVRVVLCSTLKEKVIGALHALKQRLSEDVVDFTPSEVTQCHLTIRSVTSEAKKVVRLRLLYKWGSEAIGLDSKAFACFANSSGNVACIPAVEFVGFGNSLAPVDGVPLVATNRAADLATFDQLRREGRIHCENTDLGDQLTPDHAAPSLVTPTVTSTDLATIDQLQRHGRIVCGKIEYHLHQHVNYMKGNVCVVGDKTKLAAPALNDQMLNPCALPEGPSCAPHRSITDGKRSQQSQLTPPDNGK